VDAAGTITDARRWLLKQLRLIFAQRSGASSATVLEQRLAETHGV
jgi:hypothetical protein